MTALSASHGSLAQFVIGTVGAPGVASFSLSQYLKDGGPAFARDKAETSAFGSTNKSYVMGLIDGTIPLSGMFDANVDAVLYGLFTLTTPANTVAFQYGPTGIGAGLGILYSGVGAVDKYDLKSAINAANAITANFQISGTPTRTVQ